MNTLLTCQTAANCLPATGDIIAKVALGLLAIVAIAAAIFILALRSKKK